MASAVVINTLIVHGSDFNSTRNSMVGEILGFELSILIFKNNIQKIIAKHPGS